MSNMTRNPPSWYHHLKVEWSKYDPKEHGVVGNFESALSGMIINLIEGKKSYSDILYEWDDTRKGDWYTETKKGLYGSHEESNL